MLLIWFPAVVLISLGDSASVIYNAVEKRTRTCGRDLAIFFTTIDGGHLCLFEFYAEDSIVLVYSVMCVAYVYDCTIFYVHLVWYMRDWGRAFIYVWGNSFLFCFIDACVWIWRIIMQVEDSILNAVYIWRNLLLAILLILHHWRSEVN